MSTQPVIRSNGAQPLARLSIIIARADLTRVALMKAMLYPGRKTSVSRAGGLLLTWALNVKEIPYPTPEDDTSTEAGK